MTPKAQDILKKINYIEADMAIQRQILHSIPSGDVQEMEKVMRKMAEQKAHIAELRQEIQQVDPETHQRIVAFEKGTKAFRRMAAEKQFKQVISHDGRGPLVLALKNGTRVECLVKAVDNAGAWTLMTLEGDLETYEASQVDDAEIIPPEGEIRP